jgi:hypothetical protein
LIFATTVYLERRKEGRNFLPWERKAGSASVSCRQAAPAEALSLSSLPDHSAHRLDHRKIDADSRPPAAQQLIAWQKN